MVQNIWNEQTMETYKTKLSKAYKLVTEKGCFINIIVKHSSSLRLNQMNTACSTVKSFFKKFPTLSPLFPSPPKKNKKGLTGKQNKKGRKVE